MMIFPHLTSLLIAVILIVMRRVSQEQCMGGLATVIPVVSYMLVALAGVVLV